MSRTSFVPAKSRARAPLQPPTETVSEWFDRWADYREAGGHSSVRDDRSRFRHHVEPCIGRQPMIHVQRESIEALVQHLDGEVRTGALSWKTAVNTWAVTTKMFRDAFRSKNVSLRVRPDSPCADVEGPDRGPDKSKCFLYPSEFTKLVNSDAVPLGWRRLVTLALYLGLRAGELEALEWGDIDIEHAKIMVHRAIDPNHPTRTKPPKSDAPRTFRVESSLVPLLRVTHAAAGGVGRVVRMPRHRDLAEKLREWLKAAGVARHELFISDATRINLRFHDLRASAVTWMAVRGDSPALIMNRVGHEDWGTMKKYLRVAEVVVDGFGEVFPALPQTLLGDAGRPSAVDCEVDAAAGTGRTVELALAEAVRLAASAERWDAVVQIAGELSRRSRAHGL